VVWVQILFKPRININCRMQQLHQSRNHLAWPKEATKTIGYTRKYAEKEWFDEEEKEEKEEKVNKENNA
jgi:hypothetical protein